MEERKGQQLFAKPWHIFLNMCIMKAHYTKQINLLETLTKPASASSLQDKPFLHVSAGVLKLGMSQILVFVGFFNRFLTSFLKLLT